MVVKIPETTISPPDGGAIEPLRDGDRMNAEEFFRRYSAMPEIKKAELINGVVYMASPVSTFRHGQPHGRLASVLGQYEFLTHGLFFGDNATILLGDSDQPQPDLFIGIRSGGQCRFNDRGYPLSAPELVAEVSASSIERDSGPRFEMYRSFGAQEYILWAVDEQRIYWYRLRGDVYELLPMDEEGVIRSEVFPGLWLNARAMLEQRGADVYATLHSGMATEEYRHFKASLRTTE
jgi:Uma2 family endonuclease